MTGDRLRITDQMPSAQRMSSVVNPCCSGIESFSVFTTPPRLLFLRSYCYASNSKKPVAISLAFDHRCYRGLTTGARPGARQRPVRSYYRALTKEVFVSRTRVQRFPGDAKHRPVTLLRRSGTHERKTGLWPWTTTPQARRAASG